MSKKPIALPERITLVAQTVRILREQIRAGHWPGELPGERKLCAQLQVGRHTLRAALDELQRSGWLKVAAGQRRRINGKSIHHKTARQTEEIVLLAPAFSQFRQVGELVETGLLRYLLLKAGYSAHVHVSSSCFSSKPGRAMSELARQHPSALWIVLGSKAPLQQWFIQHGKPCFIMGSCDPALGLSSIDQDFRATCLHAVGIFRRKGHRHIALVVPRDAYGGDIQSEKGFLEGIQHAGGRVRHTILRHDGTKEQLCALLDAALRTPSPPTAFLVTHATHVTTVMTHLMKRGKRIPQDVAVISRDGDQYLDAFIPAVSRYANDSGQLARRTARAVRQWMESGSLPPRAIRLVPEFIAGETV